MIKQAKDIHVLVDRVSEDWHLLPDLDDPAWQDRSVCPVQRWHSAIPDSLRIRWGSLSKREKQIAFLVAHFNSALKD